MGRLRLQPVPERQAGSATQRRRSSGCGFPAAAGSRRCGAPRCCTTRRSAAVYGFAPGCAGLELPGAARCGAWAPALLALPCCSAAERGSEKAEMKSPNTADEAVPPGLSGRFRLQVFSLVKYLHPCKQAIETAAADAQPTPAAPERVPSNHREVTAAPGFFQADTEHPEVVQ